MLNLSSFAMALLEHFRALKCSSRVVIFRILKCSNRVVFRALKCSNGGGFRALKYSKRVVICRALKCSNRVAYSLDLLKFKYELGNGQ